MFPTASYPIVANRYAPHSDYIDIEGYDFTGAMASMEVRDAKNGGTVRATVTPVVTVTTVEGVPVSRVTWSISAVVMEAMPLDPANPEADRKLFYDVHLDPAASDLFVPFEGSFTVKAGVTQ